jgi:hypothetical protein
LGPQATHAMAAAFDKVCRSLHDAGQPDIVKEIIAKPIIDLAREGDNDLDHLCEVTFGVRLQPRLMKQCDRGTVHFPRSTPAA